MPRTGQQFCAAAKRESSPYADGQVSGPRSGICLRCRCAIRYHRRDYLPGLAESTPGCRVRFAGRPFSARDADNSGSARGNAYAGGSAQSRGPVPVTDQDGPVQPGQPLAPGLPGMPQPPPRPGRPGGGRTCPGRRTCRSSRISRTCPGRRTCRGNRARPGCPACMTRPPRWPRPPRSPPRRGRAARRPAVTQPRPPEPPRNPPPRPALPPPGWTWTGWPAWCRPG